MEVKWRVLYTADFQAIERRIHYLEASLGNENQTDVLQQSPTDGTWGACFEPMFAKLEATVLALQMLHQQNIAPNYSLNFLPDIRTGKDAVAMLAQLLVSDIAREGVDHRSELAALTVGAMHLGLSPTGRRT